MFIKRSRWAVPLALTVVGLSILAPTGAGAAATITVSTTADQFGVGPGCSLREAIRAANVDEAFGGCPKGNGADTIVLAAGVYPLDEAGIEDDAADGDLDIRADLTIRGAGRRKAVIDANGIDRAFEIDPATAGGVDVVFRRLTIREGKVSGSGGAIMNRGNLRLNRVLLTQNTSSAQGGAIASLGSLTVNRTIIAGNTAATEGGAIENLGQLLANTSTLHGNTAGPNAGGLDNAGGATATVRRTTISGNTAAAVAGVRNNGILIIERSTVSGNTTTGNGGGVHNLPASDVTITHSTIASNSAAAGGGLLNDGTATLRATILSGNNGGNCGGAALPGSTGANLDSGVTCGFGVDPSDLSTANAALGPLARNGGPNRTHALLDGSQALNSAGACTGVDQRGVPVPKGSGCERGPYERAVCQGVIVNRVGTQGDNTLKGTEKADGMLGFRGADRLLGKKGKDGLCGGKGRDRLRGGKGRDRLFGGRGRDALFGGPKADVCNGGRGNNDRATDCETTTNVP